MKIARLIFVPLALCGLTLAHSQDSPTTAPADEPVLMLDTGGHPALMQGLAFTPDGKYLVSAGDDKLIRVWDWQIGKTVRTIRGEAGRGREGQMLAMALSPDSRWLAVGGFFGPEDAPRNEEHGK